MQFTNSPRRFIEHSCVVSILFIRAARMNIEPSQRILGEEERTYKKKTRFIPQTHFNLIVTH